MKNFKENKIISKLLIILAVILSVFSINCLSFADERIQTDNEVPKTWNNTEANMPQNNISGSTGMFPQYYVGTSGRYVNLPSSRNSWTRQGSWQANAEGNVVYCAEHGAYVRYGHYDPDIHYLVPGETIIQGTEIIPMVGRPVGNILRDVEREFKVYVRGLIGDSTYYTGSRYDGTATSSSADENSLKYTITPYFPGGRDAIGYYIGSRNSPENMINISGYYIWGGAEGESLSDARNQSYMNMQRLFERLSKAIWPSRYSSDIDHGGYTEKGITETDGPEFVVLETSPSADDRYTQVGSGSYSNDQKAYILTSLENAYGERTEYGKKYSLNDMQTAYWLALGQTPSKGTANGRTLYANSQKYAEFASQRFDASINSSLAQVIADRANQQYIVGPFSLNYPDYTAEDISYVKSLSINNGSLIYDETHRDFEIILEQGGTEVPGANGMQKHYPKAGEKFFIKFSASSIGYATSVNLDVQFEYINGTNIDYTQLDTYADIYKYYGYCDTMGEYKMAVGTVSLYAEYLKGYTDTEDDPDTAHPVPDYDETGKLIGTHIEYDKRDIYLNRTISIRFDTITVYQPYIKQGDEPEESGLSAQTLTIAKDGKRNYAIESRDVSISLSMELGGYTWEDAKGGKESVSNGIYGGEKEGDKKISNMQVTLYRQDGSEIGSTRTDSNGEYRFYGLNAMYQYYVKFTYNGQYYQPTTFSSANTWGGSNWQVNSNAQDRISDPNKDNVLRKEYRESYNKVFESIGSSPENYKITQGNSTRTNKTFTKLELQGYRLQPDGTYQKTEKHVIDEFGNLSLEDGINTNDSTVKSMIQYVQDCMIDAYTINYKENSKTDYSVELYPVPAIFLIDSYYKWVNTPRILAVNGIGGISILYDNAYYINLGVERREESDLAIKKDVDKVTLEINGQTHTYTYDTLENKANAENQWDISVRLSDAYYNTNYSRELYKSDYIYKASMYGSRVAELGKTKDDELEVYITYKIMVRNQALSVQTRLDELVDYYDQDLEYIDNRSYIEIKRGENQGKYTTKANATSRYGKNTETKITGYDNLYVTGLSNNAQKITNQGENEGQPIEKGIYLEAGQTAYVYLTFKVKKDTMDGEDWVRLDEELVSGTAIGVGKENIAEVNGYTTRYANGTKVPNIGDVSLKPAGIVDRDSNPGNLNAADVPKDGTIRYENFEDDTDKAPNIRIILYRNDDETRVISGSVWEDERNKTIEVTTTGDGERKEETLINGVTVQLVELMENGKEYVWREFGAPATNLGQEIGGTNTIGKGTGTGTINSETPIINYRNLIPNYEFADSHDGTYAFKSFMPGKYVVRFIYGDTEKTVLTKDANTSVNKTLGKSGLNSKSYNGQDYKSTTYQTGIEQTRKYIWREKSTWVQGNEILGKVLTEVTAYDKTNSDHNETTTVPTLDTNGNVDTSKQKGYYYDITASDKANNVSDAKDIESRRNEVIDYSDDNAINHIAEVLVSHRELPEYLGNSYNTTQLQSLIDELIDRTKMKAETGLISVELEYDQVGTDGNKKDNKYKIENVDLGLEERPKAQLAIDKEVTNVKLTLADGSVLFDAKDTAQNVLWREHNQYKVGYKGNFMDSDLFGNIVNIRNKNSSKFGLIQLSMDEELMHGATIKVTYKITVSNVGEVDYKDNCFYYTGIVKDKNTIVTTKANQVIDYVANNLQFNVSENSNWKVIDNEKLLSDGLVNNELKEIVDRYNTIIITENLGTDLVPTLYKDKINKNAKDNVSVPLVLTQLITSENDTDDLTYSNVVEIVKTSNIVGRRNEYSVVGNQDATKLPQELDADKAEVVKILPPFGNAIDYILIAVFAIGVVGIITIGIIFIKKKVLIK